MIVLGSRRVDFLVTQFANGVGDDDCQEVLIGSGPDTSTLSDGERKERRDGHGGAEVEVDLSFLLDPVGDEHGDGTAGNEAPQTIYEAVERTVGARRAVKL